MTKNPVTTEFHLDDVKDVADKQEEQKLNGDKDNIDKLLKERDLDIK